MTQINLTGLDGYETYVVDEEKMIIGIRPKWLSVKERLPDKHTPVIVCCWLRGIDYVAGGIFLGESWEAMNHDGYSFFDRSVIVSHWMPLPEKPKGEV